MGNYSHVKISTMWLLVFIFISNMQYKTLASETAKVEKLEDLEEDAKVSEVKSDLEHAESKDPQKLEIVKQIRRLNQDGSYTVGYEAEDGTFKIESRDVLGNVKGTYGYVDGNGDIKRVSYSANNGTGMKNVAEEPTTLAPRNNRTFIASTTRRPTSLAYLTNPTVAPTRASVIQSIPRKRIIVPYPTEKGSTNSFYITSKHLDTTQRSVAADSTTTVVYATSAPTAKSTIIVRPTPLPISSFKTQEQLSRPDKLEIDQVSKVQISSHRETSTSKPVIEVIEDKNQEEKKPTRGNNLRRQLSQQVSQSRERDDNFKTQQQIIYSQSSGDEGGNIYGGSSGTLRPIFTTTTTPRIPAIVIAARNRAAALQNTINSNPQTTSTTEKVYANPPRRPEQPVEHYESTTEATSENTYLTHTAGPVVQIPPNRNVQASSDDDSVVYRRRPIPPQHFEQQFRTRDYPRPFLPNRGAPYRQPQSYRNDREQFLRETSENPLSSNEATQVPFGEENLIIPPNLPPFRNQRRPSYSRNYNHQQVTDTERPYEQQSIQIPIAQNQYRPQFSESQYYNTLPERPLTTRDFETLLQILILRHQQLQQTRFGYLGGLNQYVPGYSPSVSPYLGNYQQIPRPPIYDPGLYDPRNLFYRPSNNIRQYTNPENTYQPQNQEPGHLNPYEGHRLALRKKQYNSRYFGAASTGYTDQDFNHVAESQQTSDDYLPSNVREDLLYRMLMLAIQSEQMLGTSPIPSTSTDLSTTVRGTPYSKKPVRSVQILGEDV